MAKKHKVPKRRKGGSWVAYHDGRAEMIRDAEEAGQKRFSNELQRRAGKVAAAHESVRDAERGSAKSGPGTYPWYECVDDQRAAGYSQERADQICGRIRADSRARYPEYWAAREAGAKKKKSSKKSSKPRRVRRAADANPAGAAGALAPLGAHLGTSALADGIARVFSNPGARGDGAPYCGIGLDAGPKAEPPRDNIIILDRAGNILEMMEAPATLAELDARYPGLPIFGPFKVLASDIRRLRRQAAHGTPVIEETRPRGRR